MFRGLVFSTFVIAAAFTTNTDAQDIERPASIARSPSIELVDRRPVRANRQSVANFLAQVEISDRERRRLRPKYPVEKPDQVAVHEGLDQRKIIVKFVDGASIREATRSPKLEKSEKQDVETLGARLDNLAPLAKGSSYDQFLLRRQRISSRLIDRELTEFRSIVKSQRLAQWGSVYTADSTILEKIRIATEKRFGRRASDLSNYYWFELEKGERGTPLANALNGLRIVEQAYLAPIPKTPDDPPVTPNFQANQGYLNVAPAGIDAQFAWTLTGGAGAGMNVADIESGWNLTHEDLPDMFLVDGNIATNDSRQHGTAVMSIMLGLNDGAGVTGIASQSNGAVVSVRRNSGVTYREKVADAIIVAVLNMDVGDVILIEQHARGPGNDGDCNLCITADGDPRDACGFIAMEYWDHIFDAIAGASASGLLVAEAAGNGEMDFDNDRYNNKFDRNVRNSGAIVIGAGTSTTPHTPTCFSNYGARVDVQGWGQNVMAAGYGPTPGFQINGPADDDQWYTNAFSGTSSATPIVAGAMLAIQGVQLANNNPLLDWFEMSNLLISTGTAQGGTRLIGPLPDLQAALTQLVNAQPPTPEDAVFETDIVLDSAVVAPAIVAGITGDQTEIVGNDGDMLAIERLRFGERGDRPCYVRVEKAHITENTVDTPHDELDICNHNGPNNQSIAFVPTLTTSHDIFFRGVSVCNSHVQQNAIRLKGVKVFRTRVETDGSLTNFPTPVTWERANCDGNWRSAAMCPAGSIGTKLVVHTRPDGNNRVFTGLSLQCQAVTTTRTCISGC